jgi:hypothetical protein
MTKIKKILSDIEACTNFEVEKRLEILNEGMKYIPFKLFFESAFNPNIKFFIDKVPEPFNFDEFKIHDMSDEDIDKAMQYIHLLLKSNPLPIPDKVDVLYNRIFKYLSPAEGEVFIEMFEKRFKIKGIKQDIINEFYALPESEQAEGDVKENDEEKVEPKSEEKAKPKSGNKKGSKKKS